MEHKCEPANHAINVLHWHGPYLCLIEVFDTNTVHNRSKRPGSLRLLEKKMREYICYSQKTGTPSNTGSMSASVRAKTAAV